MKPIVTLIAVLVFAGWACAAEVELVKDLPYYEGTDADPSKHKLDLFLPKGEKDYPVVVFVHGGAWVWGDRKQYALIGETFARNGIGTAVISYRLSPKVMHPAHIQDVAKAFAWVKKNIGKFGGKADQMFLCGHSAGGHLVSLLAIDDSYLKAEGCGLKDVKGVIPISGVFQIVPGVFFAPVFGNDAEVVVKASPIDNVTGDHPPFLIVYGDLDLPLCDVLSEKMAKVLKDARGEATTLEVKERNHITVVFNMQTDDDPAVKASLEFIEKLSGWKRLNTER